jgi:YggT family protein
MAEYIEHTRHVKRSDRADEVAGYQEAEVVEQAHRQTVAARIIWYVAGILLTLLAFRFVLALLGANPNNGFANFIYSASHPFVAPFFSLFGYNLQYGVSRFETFTLVAMAVYALIAYGLVRLVTINRRY